MADDPEMRSDPPDSGVEATVRPRPKKRRVLKFFTWCVVMALVILTGLSIVAYAAYHNLTAVVNRALAEFAAPYRITIGEIEFSGSKQITIKDLTVNFPKGETATDATPDFFTANAIELDYDLDELRTRKKFRAIRVVEPTVRIDRDNFSITKEPNDPGKTVEIGTPVLGVLGQLTDSLSVSGGRAEVALNRLPPVNLDWDLETGALDFGGEKWLMDDPVDLKISNFRVGQKGKLLRIDEAHLALKFSSDFKRMELGAIRLAEPVIRITPTTLKVFADEHASPPDNAESVQAEVEPAAAPSGALAVLLEALEIDRARFELAEFKSLPDLSFETSIDLQGIQFVDGKIEIGNGELATLSLVNLEIDGGSSGPGSESADHLAKVRQLKVEFFPAKLLKDRRIESVLLDEPVIHWNQQTASRLADQVSAALGKALEKPPASEASPPSAEPEPEPSPALKIGSFAIRGGQVDARDLSAGDLPIPAIRFDTDAHFRGLQIGGPSGFSASDTQELAIRKLEIRNPEAVADEAPLVKADEISGQLDWESFSEEKLIEKFKIAAPEFTVTDTTLAPWLSRLSGETGPPAETTTPAPETGDQPPTTQPLWIINDLAITDGVLQLDTSALAGRIPKAQGMFQIVHQSSDDPATHPYRATFDRLRVRSRAKPAPEQAPTDPAAVKPEALGGLFPEDAQKPAEQGTGTPEQDIGFMRELTIDFTAEGIQRDKKIDRIMVDGGILNIGDGLEQLVNGKPKAEEAPPEAAKPEQPAAEVKPADEGAQAAAPAVPDEKAGAWRVGEFNVTRSRVQFEALIPQIAGLEFDIETNLTDIPLGGDGLLSESHPQKVELTGIQIRDPYGGFQPVANLPTIFVEFTLAGLVAQRVDRIDLIGPELFVGEPLFQWIDYQRRFRKQNEGAGVGLEGAARPIDPPAGGKGDWEIKEIKAHAGKIIIAPVGYPLGVVPFPFEATTNMDQGKIDLVLDIPDENHVYRFPDFELDLHGLKGEVAFNVPIEQEENNLVQVFNLKRAIWKQYEARDLWMSVSFDADVIHGEFGGQAYDGYAEGQFNVYLKELGKWDAWIGGTTMDMGPITDVLAPENFRMDGVIDCKLVSEGKGLIFGETWGDINMVTPGRFNVTKLDDMLENLPESWSMMKRSATQLGLETLKDFDYEEGRADLYFVDRDGWFKLRLAGQTGTRVVNLYAHDWRKKKPKGEEAAENETKLDTAAADPSNETKQQGSIDE